MKALKDVLLFFFAALLLFPSSVKLAHFFANHQHIYCDHYTDSHFHQKNADCDLFQFQQVPVVSLDFLSFEPYSEEIKSGKPVSPYNFLSDYQKLCFELRGPPSYFPA